ncbi:TlpA family protein disulfide reductase [Noviherbaspirillum sedimenti]|uniref:TlpA family protein disulfide reductase n=1 Tax=Noviherbaspirillum sedimenti TaxID=2320865 RepID=A0A3A3GN66_9BURK|nr:TlpA disulfide reductase family protein [Noviherbaspirillum sedimenti]RJG03746.1 TlpA family protein disulfide reductase [Noviherbaspirillum sedimenti]
MKKEIWLGILVALLAGAIGVYFGLKKWEAPSAGVADQHYFFSQSLPDINDKNEKMSNWHGKLLLVNLWATWCAPCVEEMPELSSLQNEQSFNNLQVIGIGIDSADNMREFAAKHKISYPLYVAGMGGIELARKMGNQHGGLPFTLLIGPDGQVKKTYMGRLDMQSVRRDLGLFS